VADTGAGIAADQLPHVFERFHRVRGARSRTHEGTGIGLALVQELVTLHGGTITVDSSCGDASSHGTTFTVSIPIAAASAAPVTMPDMRPSSSMSPAVAPYVSEAAGWIKPAGEAATPSSPAGRARVLVADDNADMREYVRRLLGDRWAVETVGDGASALQSIHARRPDVIVSDVMMPELDGFELLKALKENPATREIPVILLSARAGEESALEGIGAGADDYLVKPFTARALVARVEAQLHRAAEQRRAREQLIEANRIKDEFLATLSHELRTPLNAILGWAHLLKSPALQPGILERALESIQRNARAQAQLVDDLLDVSRVISGKLTIKCEPVNLRAVISEAVDAVRPSMTAKAVRLRMGVATDADITIDGDGDRLRQVVWNLLANAVKFTPSGGTVDIEVRRADGNVEIVVRDSGMGISPEFLPHVFERFRQGDSGPSRKHGGLGLGLAIVRHLVEAHGGTVSADSGGLGMGAEFIVRLPTETARPRSLSVVSHKAPPIDQLIAGVRVLVADDEPDAREVLRMLLESHGADVVSVATAAEALQALTQSPFDAVVADIGMPGEDGYSLMRSIRLLPADQGGAIPAIAVTAYATLRERDDALNAGFTAHMSKPFDPDRLVATISKLARGGVSS
jgi:signal transduction histidine kinase